MPEWKHQQGVFTASACLNAFSYRYDTGWLAGVKVRSVEALLIRFTFLFFASSLVSSMLLTSPSYGGRLGPNTILNMVQKWIGVEAINALQEIKTHA